MLASRGFLVMRFLSSRLCNIVCCVFAFAAPAFSQDIQVPASTPATLAGLWGTEARFGEPVKGELTLDGRGGTWKASIAGYEFPVDTKDGKFDFAIPGNKGEFRGSLDRTANVIDGQWIQPLTDILDRQYVSPVHLHPVVSSVWRGTVDPLDLSISVYASITVSPDGTLKAFFSNPEANFFHGKVFNLTRDGDKIHLDAGGWKMEGAYDEKTDALSFQFVDFLPVFKLSRRENRNAVGFYPRVPAEDSTYRYRPPVASEDGWRTASFAEEGLDEKPIEALVNRILTSNPSTNPLLIQSLLIARHGRLVLDEYFYGFDQQRVHDVRSEGKTFAPVLVGLAREQGVKLDPTTPVYPLFSQYKAFENWDARKRAMTLRDLMTMTAGNACDDNDDKSPGNEDQMQGDSKHNDWYKYTLDLPMLKQPGGENAVYCSADLNLVGGAVASATGAWLPNFFDKYLARPLQFGNYYMNLMPDGQAYMGGGAYLLPRDELKLGQLFLDGGVWNGKRLLSKAWVEESTSFHSKFDPRYSLGTEHEYGYGWHINFLKSGEKTYRVLAAGGNGGQFVIIVPELDLVVGINGGSYGQFDQWYRWELELVPQFILPAAER